jgi:hypothetical protein
MNNNNNPIRLLFFAFSPFIISPIVNEIFRNDIYTWSTYLFSSFFVYKLLIKSFSQKLRLVFYRITLFSFILTIFASYFALLLEGYDSFLSIQDFSSTNFHNSDLAAVSVCVLKFISIFQEDGLLAAVSYPYSVMGYYNNILSPLKFGLASLSMPNIGYYAMSIQAWWFILTFYLVCLFTIPDNTELKENSFYVILLPFLILPFAVPYDREAIVIIPISIISLFIVKSLSFNFYNIFSITLSLFLILLHRNAYAPIVPLIFLMILFSKNRFFLSVAKNYTSKSVLFFFIFIVIVASNISNFTSMLDSSFSVAEDALKQFNTFEGASQDTWQQFQTGMPFFDNIVKTIFLLITPFPIFQLFKSGAGDELLIHSVYISVNIIPIFMLGKLFVTIIFINQLLFNNYKNILLIFFALLFLTPILASPRTAPAYLLPSLCLIVIWLIGNGVKIRLIKKSINTYFVTMFFLHFIYLIVYGRI